MTHPPGARRQATNTCGVRSREAALWQSILAKGLTQNMDAYFKSESFVGTEESEVTLSAASWFGIEIPALGIWCRRGTLSAFRVPSTCGRATLWLRSSILMCAFLSSIAPQWWIRVCIANTAAL